MATPFPSTGGGGGELSKWVSQVKAQHTGQQQQQQMPSPLSPTRTGNSQTADELEEEMRQSRLDRAKRRSRLSNAGVRGLDTSIRSPSDDTTLHSPQIKSPSGEETLRKLLGQRSQASSPTMERGSGVMGAPMSPPKRTPSLLDRYGGQAGPTGHAMPAASGASTSLASFMGGKATGPRLGKLAGDGRSAPPEADLIDESRNQPKRALPGLAASSSPVTAAGGLGGRSLASFLEARAAGAGGGAGLSGQTSSKADSTVASSPLPSPSLSKTAAVFPPLSPSPSNKHEFSYADRGLPSAKRAESFSRPQSPVRSSPQRSSPAKPEPIPTSRQEQDERIMTDKATSPFKDDQIASAQAINPSTDVASTTQPTSADRQQHMTPVTTQLAPASLVHSPTSEALAGSSPRFQLPVNRSSPATASPAFAGKLTTAAASKAPTASLTRLRGQSLVGQRVREAKEREAASSSSPSSSPVPGESSSPQLGRAPSLQRRWTPPTPTAPSDEASSSPQLNRTNSVQRRWTPPTAATESPTTTERKPWQPSKLGHALPGLTGHPRSASPDRSNALATSSRTEQTASVESAPPVRLPGLGAASSPFASRQSSYKHEEEDSKENGKLEHPTMARARAPKRSTAASSRSMTQINAEASEVSSLHGSKTAPVNAKPLREDDESHRASDIKLEEGADALEALVAGKKVKTPTSESPKKVTPSNGPEMIEICPSKDTARVDISPVLRSALSGPATKNSAKTISVDVLSVRPDGSAHLLPDTDAHVLYETETLVVMHRCKDAATGLMRHEVFVRAGRYSPVLSSQASSEASKVQMLASRVNAAPIDARQGRESVYLVKLLGGTIVTREGPRDRFEASNTHMYAVRGTQGAFYVDQCDLVTSKLCSAQSFVISVISDVFVWHGKGAVNPVRAAASEFARSLRDPSLESSLTEYGEGQEDELFWACFEQDTDYASSFHHELLHRLPEQEIESRLFSLVTDAEGDRAIVSVPAQEKCTFSSFDLRPDTVHVVQLPHEIYVLVGARARSDRTGISAALDAASTLARSLKEARPRGSFLPPVHAIIFPSQVPRDLQAAIRYWDSTPLLSRSSAFAPSTSGRRPLGMNIMTEREARAGLKQTRFEMRALTDHDFLPIGVSPADIM